MALFNHFNNEDILVRGVIAGLLNILNNHIKYGQVWGNDDKETINVPWFYNQSGDERFMQDFYTFYHSCLPPKPVDGNFDMIPRGVITYSGSGIDEQRITTRYVQGRYIKEVDGQLNSYVSYLYSLPLSIRIEAEMWIDTEITALKIEQEIREVFFKTKTYYSYYKGMRVGCTVGFPADIMIDKKINYTFESDNRIKLTFPLEIETYQPVFDPTTEVLADTGIKGFGVNLYQVDQQSDGKIEITRPSSGITVPKGIPFWLEWIFTKEGAVMPKVDIFWVNYGENDRNDIDRMQANNEFYIWNIPESFTDYKQPVILWGETTDTSYPISVSRKPEIKIIPDLVTNVIDSSSFSIFDNGYFYTSLDDASINIQLEMRDDDNKIYYTNDGDIYAEVLYNKLNSIIVKPDVSIVFPGTVDYKQIDIQIANSVNNDIFGVVSNIKIV